MASLNQHIADRIAEKCKLAGFDRAVPQDVWDVVKYGGVDPGTVSEGHDAALESRILQELDEYGIEV